MEQLYNQKDETVPNRSVQIDFKEATVLNDDTITILKPNKVIPNGLNMQMTLHCIF